MQQGVAEEEDNDGKRERDPDPASPPGVVIFFHSCVSLLFFNLAKRGLLEYVSPRYRPVFHTLTL